MKITFVYALLLHSRLYDRNTLSDLDQVRLSIPVDWPVKSLQINRPITGDLTVSNQLPLSSMRDKLFNHRKIITRDLLIIVVVGLQQAHTRIDNIA